MILFALAAAYDFAALRAADLRVATIATRLIVANAPICAERTPAPGLVLHALDQYAPAARVSARAAFAFEAPVAVEAVVPGSAAARAGVQGDDGIVAIEGQAMVTDPRGGIATRDTALARIAALPPDAPVHLTLRRAGVTREVTLAPAPGCAAAFEIADQADAIETDGARVQIGLRWLRFGDAAIAVLLAHELAHTMLRHRARQRAARIDTGLDAEFGRNLAINRRVEAEADRLGVHILRNAGYDPQIAVRFWREEGPRIDGGLFRSRIYAPAARRADAIAREIAAIPPGAPIPYAPPLLATRDQPLR